MSIHLHDAGTMDFTWRVVLTSSVVARSQSRVSRQRRTSASRKMSFAMLKLSGWRLGKLSRDSTS